MMMKIGKTKIKNALYILPAYRYQRELSSHQLEMRDDLYTRMNEERFSELYIDSEVCKGKGSLEGTLQFKQERSSVMDVQERHFRLSQDSLFHLSSLGIGSYKGDLNPSTDLRLFNAIQESVSSKAINYIDTALNWRYMRSQRTVAAAIKYLISTHNLSREQIVIGTKIGCLPEDIDNQITGFSFIDDLLKTGKMEQSEIINGVSYNQHFLQKSIDCSLSNLKLDSLDIVYLSHPEALMSSMDKQELLDTLKRAFELLENNISKGNLQAYGISTWDCLRVAKDHPHHLELSDIIQCAQEVAGDSHHLNYLQLPINLMMPEAFIDNTQQQSSISLLQAASQYKLTVQSTSPLLSGSLINIPIDMTKVPLNYQSARHLQFIRSMGGVSTTIVGMKTSQHVRKNLEVAVNPPLSEEEFLSVFVPPTKRTEQPQQPIDLDDLL